MPCWTWVSPLIWCLIPFWLLSAKSRNKGPNFGNSAWKLYKDYMIIYGYIWLYVIKYTLYDYMLLYRFYMTIHDYMKLYRATWYYIGFKSWGFRVLLLGFDFGSFKVLVLSLAFGTWDLRFYDLISKVCVWSF
jgi:hypothetical protein